MQQPSVESLAHRQCMEMMLDSGSSVSLICLDVLEQLPEFCRLAAKKLRLASAAGEPIPVVDHVAVSVRIGELQVTQPFVVVASLIAPVILGMDFLRTHGIILDFASRPITVMPRPSLTTICEGLKGLQPIVDAVTLAKRKLCAAVTIGETAEDMVEDCMIPRV